MIDWEVLGTMDSDPWSPQSICARCGRTGTVAVVNRRDRAVPERRICGECWPEEVAEQTRLRLAEEAQFSVWHRNPAVTWQQVERMAVLAEAALAQVPAHARVRSIWRLSLHVVASHLRADASRLDGEMPQAVRAFIERATRDRH